MTKLFYYMELILIILIGSCGIFLLIGGICLHNVISILFGILFIILPILIKLADR